MIDAVIAVALAAAGQVAIWTGATSEGPRTVTVWTGLLITVPLAWRRSAPTGAALAWMAGGLAQAVLADSASSIWALAALLLMSFSLGAGTSGRRRLWLGLAFVGTVWVTVLVMPGAAVGDRLFTAPLLGGGPLLVGVALQRQQARAERLTRKAVELERDREQRARDAVAAERTRIARELHDVVAHAVSVMVVQAGAAEELMDLEPERAKAALAAVRDSGKQSLEELRRMLGMLRPDADGVTQLTPQPGLADLPALVATHRAAGLSLTFEAEAHPGELPAGLDLAAYRVVQEALTNVRKHAVDATHAVVRLRFEAETLHIEVRDDGTPRAAEVGSGHGLVGMRERVSLYGGVLTTGPAPGGGWRVAAVLPTPTPAARQVEVS
jgi:signal transduction histidine kinase